MRAIFLRDHRSLERSAAAVTAVATFLSRILSRPFYSFSVPVLRMRRSSIIVYGFYDAHTHLPDTYLPFLGRTIFLYGKIPILILLLLRFAIHNYTITIFQSCKYKNELAVGVFEDRLLSSVSSSYCFAPQRFFVP